MTACAEGDLFIYIGTPVPQMKQSQNLEHTPEYSEAERPAQLCALLVGQMGSSSFPEAELLSCSVYARNARYFAIGDSLRSDTPTKENILCLKNNPIPQT